MKRILLIFIVLISFIGFSQKNCFKSGIYKNDTSYIFINMIDETFVFCNFSGDSITNADTLHIIHVDKSIIIARRNCENKDKNKQLKNNVESRVSECSPYSNLRIDVKKKGNKLLLWVRKVVYKKYRDWNPKTVLKLE